MTRLVSVGNIRVGRRVGPPVPREGTARRRAYDALRSGQLVHVSGGDIEALRDQYGMELLGVRSGGHQLLGEWEGDVFVPVERIVQDYAG